MSDDRLTVDTLPNGPAATVLAPADVRAFVEPFLSRSAEFLGLARRHGSPLYILEEQVLRERARRFTAAFKAELPSVRVYYAMKSNNLPAVSTILAQAGLGIDVSSGRELEAAVECGAQDIVFSGPGKTDEELRLAVACHGQVTVLTDSFLELDRLDRIAGQAGVRARAGVRLTTDERGLWRKFGIPLSELRRFVDTAENRRHIRWCGLQFHSSWNLSPAAQVEFIERLGAGLRGLTPAQRGSVEFIDIGGGFWPPAGEWLHARPAAEGRPSQEHLCCRAAPIEEFAREIGAAARAHLLSTVDCRICMEPGRWLCHDAMHILLTVVDRKGEDIAITDGGTNAVGWERFETDYFPVLNLTRSSLTERACYILGSLCTPHDVWGYFYHGEDIQPGDVLLIPTQGAYTYSLRQEFIKPLPQLVVV